MREHIRGKDRRGGNGGRKRAKVRGRKPERENNDRSKKEETGRFAGGFLVWVRNLPLCQTRLDIK